ncbi:MAG: hypothetical protein ABR987_19550 [Terracidiphilus sp.]
MMQRWMLMFLAAWIALPVFAAGQVTVDQLETTIAKAHRKSDAHIAKQISSLELTERLSTVRLARLNAELAGEESRLALIALADRSAFLELPPSEIPAMAAPDLVAQDVLLAKTAKYAKETLSKLPDFFATQETIQFSGANSKDSSLAAADSSGQKLHLVSRYTATVRFLGGQEEIERGRPETRSIRPGGKQLAVQGVFGPILRVVLKDALANHPVWSHWEQGTGAPIAVFHYDVPEDKSHYAVAGSIDSGILQPITAYRGEIGLDQSSGAILRLTLIAVPHANSPIARGDLLVEYGPVEIGGRTYICPRRSVAISLARGSDLLHDVYKFPQAEQLPFQLELNDVAYAQYHLFHTEMRLLPGETDGNPVSPLPSPAPKP